jgi:hypothetical protein
MHLARISRIEPSDEAFFVLGKVDAGDADGIEPKFDGGAPNIGGQRLEVCDGEFHGGAVLGRPAAR